MAKSPEAAGAAPANRKLTNEEKAEAYKALEKSVTGKLEEYEAIMFINKINMAMGRIDDTESLKGYLETMQSRAHELRHNQQISLQDRNLLTDGLKIVAQKCGVELKGIGESR